MFKTTYRENFFIMLGHLCDDLCQGALPVVLALMYEAGILTSYAQVAMLIMATTLVNAIAQPIAGLLADKKPRPYLMALGMLTAAFGIMFIGLIDNIYLIALFVTIQGIGVAVFHPSAGKLANIFAGEKVGRGMSIFSVGGNIGYAVGPVYFTACYYFFGLKGTLLMIIPALIMSIIFFKKNRMYEVRSKRDITLKKHKKQQNDIKEDYKGTFFLILLVFARSAAFFSLTTFLPLYFMHNLNQSEELSSLTLTLVGICGAISTLIGGFISDKFGFTQWTRLTSVLVVPFAVLFVLTSNVYIAILALIPFAIFYYASMSPIVVIGQKLLPLHIGMATGLTIGLGISFGGIIAPVLGNVGDNYGLNATMMVIAGLTALAAVLSFTIPIVNKAKK